MIYLAQPYHHDDPAVMEARFEAACRVAGRLMDEGLVVYGPVIHNHPIATRVGLPRGWDYWERYDTEMLKAATALYILKLPGWDTSRGVAAEIKIAQDLGLPITYIDP